MVAASKLNQPDKQKPSSLARPDDSGSVIQTTGGEGLIVTNASVRSLITFAYDIRDLQLSGGPGWLGTDRFNITAKTAPDDAAFGATKQDSMTVTLGGGRRRGFAALGGGESGSADGGYARTRLFDFGSSSLAGFYPTLRRRSSIGNTTGSGSIIVTSGTVLICAHGESGS